MYFLILQRPQVAIDWRSHYSGKFFVVSLHEIPVLQLDTGLK
jgi:hypothetical protein